jgi:DNA-binding NarL/FixJ family response regulator
VGTRDGERHVGGHRIACMPSPIAPEPWRVEMGTSTGGRVGSTSLRARAVSCLVDPERASRVRDALDDLGFSVTEIDDAAELRNFAIRAPTLLVVDASLPGWLGEVARLTESSRGLQTLLVGDLDGPDGFLAAVAAGVSGFCGADSPTAAIARTVESMLDSGVAIPRSFVRPLVESVRNGPGRRIETAGGPVQVTDREWDVVQMLLQRRSTREIADALFVSVGTVRSHVSTLLRKLGATDRDDAVQLIERGRGPT